MSEWAFPEHNDIGMSMLVAGACGIGYSVVTAGHPGWLAPIAAGALGTWSAIEGFSRWTAKRQPDGDGDVPMLDSMDMGMGMDPFGMMQFPPHMMENGQVHPSVGRLLNVLQAKWPDKFSPIFEAFEFEETKDGGSRKLISYGFRSNEPGFLSSTGRQSTIQQEVTSAVKGNWKPKFDTESDSFFETQLSGLPRLSFPPNWPVIRTPEEAKDLYASWEYYAGDGENGKIGFSPNTFPHALIVGGSGGGKSIAGLSWIEQYRASGWMLIFGDGKGADYAGYAGVPGVLAIGRGSGTRGMEYIAAIKLAYDIMTDRQDNSAEAKIADPAGWNRFTPVLLVLDEIKSVLKKWKSALPAADFKKAVNMVDQILSLGRELRVHVLCLTQDVYDESIPGSWVSNISLKVNIGVPHHMTLKKAFPEAIRPQVQMLGDSMDQSIKGRSLVGAFDEDSGASAVIEYQGYLSYAPGLSWDNPKIPKQAAEQQNWPSFKQNVSDRVPHMYSRQWFAITDKSDEQVKTETKTGDMGFIDLELYSYDELMALKRIGLDERKPDGTIGPRAEVARFDPDIRNPEYVCKKPMTAAGDRIAETL